MKTWILALTLAAAPVPGLADGLHGNCFEARGARCSARHRITTDFSPRKAVIDPVRGTYDLDYGVEVGRTVTIFCDGKKVGALRLEGSRLFVVHCE